MAFWLVRLKQKLIQLLFNQDMHHHGKKTKLSVGRIEQYSQACMIITIIIITQIYIAQGSIERCSPALYKLKIDI